MAEMARRHNDANMLALAADRLAPDAAWKIVETFSRPPSRADATWPASRRSKAQRATPGTRTLPPHAARKRRSRNRAAAARRSEAPGARHRADRVRELRLRSGARSGGLRAHQQVRRRLPGRRYYGACDVVDQVDSKIEIARAKGAVTALTRHTCSTRGISSELTFPLRARKPRMICIEPCSRRMYTSPVNISRES